MVYGTGSRASVMFGVIALVAAAVASLPVTGRPAIPAPALRVDAWCEGIAFAPNAKVLACGVSLRDAASGKLLRTGDPGAEVPPCTCVVFSPDGRQLASVHFSRNLIRPPHALCLWDVTGDHRVSRAATLLHEKDQPHLYEESLHYLIFSPDGRTLATRLPGDKTAVWETASGKERLRLDTRGLAVTFAPDGRALTSVSRTGLVQHWDLATGKRVAASEGARRQDFLFVCNAVASADGKTLALSDNHSVVVKEAKSGKTLRRFGGLAARCLALSAEGRTLAVVTGGVLLLDVATGKETGRLAEWKESVHGVAFSPDGKSLAVGLTKAVEVWEVAALARAEKPKHVRGPAPPLEAKLLSRKGAYTLALGGKTAEDFAEQFEVEKPLPASPEVDLVLSLRNSSDKKLTFDPKGAVESYLVGEGALNHPVLPYQTGFSSGGSSLESRKVTLKPGESYSVPITSLNRGHHRQSYWLLPGEYTLHLSYRTWVTPAPEGWCEVDGTGYGTLRAAPLRLKVLAEK